MANLRTSIDRWRCVLSVCLGSRALVRCELAGELVEAHRAEDAFGEELVDERQERVLAQVQPLAVSVDLFGLQIVYDKLNRRIEISARSPRRSPKRSRTQKTSRRRSRASLKGT
jgi:hypothetical protein